MSISTHIEFLNGNDARFMKASQGTARDRAEWEAWEGPIEDRPGAPIACSDDVIKETADEYGGWLIAIKDIPKNATHIIISRS